MRALDLAGIRRAHVLAPHPDDETIGAFGLIRALTARGASVAVTVVTDGAASHRNSRAWPAPRLRAARRAETARAMRRAGVCANAVRHLGYADGGLDTLSAGGRRGLAAAIAAVPPPDLLVLPSINDHHADHRAVARAGWLGAPAGVRRLSYLVWPGRKARVNGPRYTLKLGARVHMKRAAIHMYRTQTGLIDDDPDGFRLTPAMIARFCRPVEIFGGRP